MTLEVWGFDIPRTVLHTTHLVQNIAKYIRDWYGGGGLKSQPGAPQDLIAVKVHLAHHRVVREKAF